MQWQMQQLTEGHNGVNCTLTYYPLKDISTTKISPLPKYSLTNMLKYSRDSDEESDPDKLEGMMVVCN